MIDHVPTVYVIDVAVGVVVDTISRDLSRIRPDTVDQVRVIEVDTGVEHGHYDGAGTGGPIPRLDGIDIGVSGAARLPRVLKGPLIAEKWIVEEVVEDVGDKRRSGSLRRESGQIAGHDRTSRPHQRPSEPDVANGHRADSGERGWIRVHQILVLDL